LRHSTETEHVRHVAAQTRFVRDVIGRLPRAGPAVAALIAQNVVQPKLRGHAIDLLLASGNLSRASRFVDGHATASG